MALVVITSAAVTAPATAAAAAVVLTLRRTWHHLQAQTGAMGGAAVVEGASNTATGHSTKPGTAIHSVIYNAIISYSIDMHIKHEP